ncbi:MAG: DUF938 domain-containing protein [Gammaproteobacteria bacterium]|jgi:cyclopropane fatty-acyl-phospholipid synthase-like methyltransferase|nr:DUF938 domain-containing protein [Gammaproteobacteria bacterium]MBT3488364.1 DUF938 domain-containing protein [Gammaproteobacteria bacterium]MBT3719445.1 DUF938 domain-containing protein [Gammaproteobacteria bacterium]MBT3845602.1 DUF938 domain-containing protein [Gammaproteobacteria bacterium]MBT3894132.1 DUF938 domain-containing protein [Gammaproteobacteria bacterium]
MKQFSQSCIENRDPILSVIQPLLSGRSQLLEIGSGSGQHAVDFAQAMPHLSWQCSDRLENHPSINAWLEERGLSNTPIPLELDVTQEQWPQLKADAVFSANTAHIMSLQMVESFVSGVANVLSKEGIFLLYGPFNYKGDFTSESNRSFDQWLKQRDPASGVRDFEWLNQLAEKGGMRLQGDVAMPANNRILYWKKVFRSDTTLGA